VVSEHIVLNLSNGTTKIYERTLNFDQTTKNFNQWKKIMVNYLNILEIWEVVKKDYVPKYN
jgi:uncharacterized protein YfbU (UPF0304 family)